MLSRLSTIGGTRRATIDYVNSQGLIYLQIQIEDATVASHSFSSTANGGSVETFSLVFQEWKTSFYMAKDSGREEDHPVRVPGWERLTKSS